MARNPERYSLANDRRRILVTDWEAADGSGDLGLDEQEACRRLLAFDGLVAACEQFLALHPKERDDIALEDMVRAALAKARGGTP